MASPMVNRLSQGCTRNLRCSPVGRRINRRLQSTSATTDKVDVEKLLEHPTWNVESLLPKADSQEDKKHITSKQLHHLLRLSALPPPKDTEEESQMLSTLSSQLHFVREIQKVDTTGIEPLQSLRDETQAGRQATTIGLEELKDAFAKEELKGQYYKRIRRKQQGSETEDRDGSWDVLGHAGKRVGRYFVVEGGKEGGE